MKEQLMSNQFRYPVTYAEVNPIPPLERKDKWRVRWYPQLRVFVGTKGLVDIWGDSIADVMNTIASRETEPTA